MSSCRRGAREIVRRDIIMCEQGGVAKKRWRKPSSPWQLAVFKKRKLTTSSRHCQQTDEMMQLEEECLRLLAPQTPERARRIEQRSELPVIHRGKQQIKGEGMQKLDQAQEKFQRDYCGNTNTSQRQSRKTYSHFRRGGKINSSRMATCRVLANLRRERYRPHKFFSLTTVL